MERIKELDGLRAVAILLVLGCHYRGFATLFGGVPEFGFIGVDIFFVLSGYLITTILLRLREQPHPYWTFYSRRALRIFPPYFACILVVIAAAVATRDWAEASFDFIVQQAYFLQAYDHTYLPLLVSLALHPVQAFQHAPSLLMNAHRLPRSVVGIAIELPSVTKTYWSLSIEEYFYLFWAPVVLLWPKRRIVVTAIAVCAVEIALRWTYGHGSLEYPGLIFRFDALMYGALLALVFAHWKETRTPRAAFRLLSGILLGSAAALGAILFAVRPVVGYEVRESPLFMVFGMPLISTATAATIGMLVLRADSKFWLARVMRWKFMQFIGTISYTMYLVHVLVLVAVDRAIAGLAPLVPRAFFLLEGVLSAAVTIAIARLSWHFLEKPILRMKDRKFPAARVAEPVLG
jgi:peptidoglycan/LPS O-acetylase OafA/YrhL